MMYVIALRAASITALAWVLFEGYNGFYLAMKMGRVALAAMIVLLTAMGTAFVTLAALVTWGVL